MTIKKDDIRQQIPLITEKDTLDIWANGQKLEATVRLSPNLSAATSSLPHRTTCLFFDVFNLNRVRNFRYTTKYSRKCLKMRLVVLQTVGIP